MRAFAIVSVLLLATIAEAASKQGNRVLLSNVKSLTLRKDAKTSHRRVPAVPQVILTQAFLSRNLFATDYA